MEIEKLKDAPEVELARAYFSTTYRIWKTRHEVYHGRCPKNCLESLNPLSKAAEDLMNLTIEKFILPNLKNKLKYNGIDSFVYYSQAWSNYFYGMSDKDYSKFKKLEDTYHREGSCPEFESIKLPTEYKFEFVDLTKKEWEEQMARQNNADQYKESFGENSEITL